MTGVVVVTSAGSVVKAIPCDGAEHAVTRGVVAGLELVGARGYDVHIYPEEWPRIRSLLYSLDPLQGAAQIARIKRLLERALGEETADE